MPLVRFFLLVAALVAIVSVIGGFVSVPGLPKNGPITDFALAFVPAIAALVLTYRESGGDGVRALLRRIVDHRRITNKIWYLPVFLLPVVLLATTYALMVVTGVRFQTQPALSPKVMALFVVVFFVAAIGEELGWSGYASEPLQRRFGALGGSVVLGAVWWLFHVPSILRSGQGPVLVTLGAAAAVATRVLWMWLFNNTGGSVFAIVLVHTVSNICGSYVPAVPTSANAPVAVVLAVVVTVCWGSRRVASSNGT